MKPRERPLRRKLGRAFERIVRLIVVVLFFIGDAKRVVKIARPCIKRDRPLERGNRVLVPLFVRGDASFAKELLCFKLRIRWVQASQTSGRFSAAAKFRSA